MRAAWGPAICSWWRARRRRCVSTGGWRRCRAATSSMATTSCRRCCRRCRRTPGRRSSRAGAADARLRAGVGRFRVNVHRERGRAAAAIRVLPLRPPRLATLNLPAGVEQLSRIPRGLVLVGGATGVGKTTTLAAIVDEINRRDREAHRHHRRSGRVRAPARRVDRRARRDRHRRDGFPDGAAGRGAPGAGRDRRRRDARPRDDADRAGRRRDRARRLLERAHHRRGLDRGAHRRRVPGGAPADDPPGAGDGAGRDLHPDAGPDVAAAGWCRPASCWS